MIEQLILLPNPQHLALIDLLSILVLMIHLPYMGFLIGSTLFSLYFNIHNRFEPNTMFRRLAVDFTRILPTNISVLIILGIIPLVTLMVVYSQWFYQTNNHIIKYFMIILSSLIAGLIMILVYFRLNRKSNPLTLAGLGIGGLGLTAILNAYFVYSTLLTEFIKPELKNILFNPESIMYTVDVLARFTLFFNISLAVTGIGILFYWYYWNKNEKDESYNKYFRNFGAILALVSITLLPLSVIWNVIIMPYTSYSILLFVLYALAILLMIIISYSLYINLLDRNKSFNYRTMFFSIIVIAILISNDHLAKDNSNFAHKNILTDKATLYLVELEDKRGIGGEVKPDPALGEEIYKLKCTTCHSFNRKIVGPPHDDVLPKYRDDLDTLRKYIKKPWKINPAYPSMPAQPLNRKELESVIAYMFQHLNQEKKSE